MKVLHLMSFPPEPPVYGGALRIHHLLKHLSGHHDVTAVCFGEPNDAGEINSALTPPPKNVRVVPYPWTGRYRRLGQLYSYFTKMSYIQTVCYSQEMQQTLDKLVESDDYDFVVAEFCMMAKYELKTNAKKILDAHNVEHDNYFRMSEHVHSFIKRHHYRSEAKKLKVEEIEACRKQDAIFATSARDKEVFDVMAPNVPKFVIPNGVDTSYFFPKETEIEPNSIVFTGMMAYTPNYDGMLYFLDKIFPLIVREIPGAKAYIVGSKPPDFIRARASSNIIVTGFVDDVRPYVWRAKAYVVPLRMGGGTRLKVVEAMAMKKPIITTSIGCEGIEVHHGESVLIADDPRDFAETVISVLRDKIDHQRIAQNGLELARLKYDWSVIGDKMERSLQNLLQYTESSVKL